MRGSKNLSLEVSAYFGALENRDELNEEDIMQGWPWPDLNIPADDVTIWSSIVPPVNPVDATDSDKNRSTNEAESLVKPASPEEESSTDWGIILGSLAILLIVNGLIFLACRYMMKKRRERIKAKQEHMQKAEIVPSSESPSRIDSRIDA